MKTLIIILMLTISAIVVKSQNVIALQHGNTNTIFSTFDSAMTAAANGDYIYLYGGNTINENLTINKGVHIIGAGHFPDSTQATYTTTVVGECIINTGSDNGTLEGIFFTSSIYIGAVTNYSISRCNCNSMSCNGTFNLVVKECVIAGGEIDGDGSSQNINFTNNIIEGYLFDFSNNTYFSNNIFLFNSGNFIQYCNGVLFENNCFAVIASLEYVSNSNAYNNNIFVNFVDNSPLGTESQHNNQFNIPLSSIFVNVSGNTFSYGQNYHLAAGSPAIGAGTNGTDIGIYGGTYPWKEGSVPMNPHIQTKNIGTTTNINGDLPVNIQVGAQDH